MNNFEWDKWLDESNIYVCKPKAKIYFKNGVGLYIMNASRYYLFPKFYGTFHKTFWEVGFNFAGFIFEIMWNKKFEY